MNGQPARPAVSAPDLQDRIRNCLAVLEPEAIDLFDDSASHAGHAGAAGGGGHFQITVISRNFSGKNRVERHRMIYAALAPLMQSGIHALAINAHTPDEL